MKLAMATKADKPLCLHNHQLHGLVTSVDSCRPLPLSPLSSRVSRPRVAALGVSWCCELLQKVPSSTHAVVVSLGLNGQGLVGPVLFPLTSQRTNNLPANVVSNMYRVSAVVGVPANDGVPTVAGVPTVVSIPSVHVVSAGSCDSAVVFP
jgi:hypothetical protein